MLYSYNSYNYVHEQVYPTKIFLSNFLLLIKGGSTALMLASGMGNTVIVELLLAHNADVNAESNVRYELGYSILFYLYTPR